METEPNDLEQLVDRLIEQADILAFNALNRILNKVRGETDASS